MNIGDEAKKGVKWTSIAKIVLAAVAILKISVLTRFLETEAFGQMALALFVMGFVGLFMDMGLSSAILHKQNIDKKTYSSLYWLNCLFSIILYLIVFFLSSYIAMFYNDEELGLLIKLIGLGLILSALGRQYKTIEQKNLNFKLISLIEIWSAVLSLVLAIILAIYGYGVYALVFSVLFQQFVSNISFLFFGARKHGLLFHFSYPETRPFLKIGIYEVMSNAINYFSRDIDIMLIGKFLGTEVLGGYSLAKQLVFKPLLIINPIITQIATPLLAKIQENKEALKSNFLKILSIISTINIPAYFLLIIFATPVVQILYGNAYLDIVPVVRILSIYVFLRALGNPVGSLLIALGRTDIGFQWNLMVLFITPIMVYAGSFFGTMGVAISLTICMILLFIPAWRFMIYSVTGISLKEYMNALIPNLQFIKGYFNYKN